MLVRLRPVVLEAIQWKGDNWSEVYQWVRRVHTLDLNDPGLQHHSNNKVTIRTVKSEVVADPGEWIIRGATGEFFTCDNNTFEANYTKLERT